MYAGRNEENTEDDIVFYGMNAYWKPLEIQLPSLPDNLRWRVCVNTYVDYDDRAGEYLLAHCRREGILLMDDCIQKDLATGINVVLVAEEAWV